MPHPDPNTVMLVLAFAGLLVAIWTGLATVRSNRPLTHQITEEDFRSVRAGLKSQRPALNELASSLQTSSGHEPPCTVGKTPFLTRECWMPSAPIPLDEVTINWGGPVPVEPRARHLAGRVLPRKLTGQPYRRYSEAVGSLAKPTLFFDAPTYSLNRLELSEKGRPSFVFHKSSYFETIDIAEALCHEFALAALREDGPPERPNWRQVPLRRFVSSGLLDPRRRPISVAITTILIRESSDGSREFFLNLRDAQATVTYAGPLMLVPTGVFQPGSRSPAATLTDFDLWRNIMREFSEEVMGLPEFDGRDGATLNYEEDEPFRTLNTALRNGRIRLYYLGFGLDPLELWPHILTAMLIEEDALAMVAPHLAEENAEGVLVGHTRTRCGIRGIPFESRNIEDLLQQGELSSATAATLHTAWRHQSSLRFTRRDC